eukprot:6615443-Prymnesium_polylepis.1
MGIERTDMVAVGTFSIVMLLRLPNHVACIVATGVVMIVAFATLASSSLPKSTCATTLMLAAVTLRVTSLAAGKVARRANLKPVLSNVATSPLRTKLRRTCDRRL